MSEMAFLRQLRRRDGLSVGNIETRHTSEVQFQSEHPQVAETCMARFATGVSQFSSEGRNDVVAGTMETKATVEAWFRGRTLRVQGVRQPLYKLLVSITRRKRYLLFKESTKIVGGLIVFDGLEIEIDDCTFGTACSVFAVHEVSGLKAADRRSADSYGFVVKLGRMRCNRANVGVYRHFGTNTRGKKHYQNRERENSSHLAHKYRHRTVGNRHN